MKERIVQLVDQLGDESGLFRTTLSDKEFRNCVEDWHAVPDVEMLDEQVPLEEYLDDINGITRIFIDSYIST